jgi:hypothetical protein
MATAGGVPVTELGRVILGVGVLLVVLGAVLMIAGRLGLPLGRLPGDVAYKGKNVSVYFPIGTSILLSVVLTVILYLVSHFRR